jgi:ketosteroid isomerase-like protein
VLVQWKGEPTASATWKDINSFIERHLDFQLEEELHVEGERCYMGKAA